MTANREKYAHLEVERRFLLSRVPEGVRGPVRIEDKYLEGTLRLRRTEHELKLGQKVRPDPEDGSRVWHTTMYLSEEEFRMLSALPGHDLVKVRWRLTGSVFAVNVFEGGLSGLVMAEAEFATDDDRAAASAPAGTVADVTGDDRFTGGALAVLSRQEVFALLREHGIG